MRRWSCACLLVASQICSTSVTCAPVMQQGFGLSYLTASSLQHRTCEKRVNYSQLGLHCDVTFDVDAPACGYQHGQQATVTHSVEIGGDCSDESVAQPSYR